MTRRTLFVGLAIGLTLAMGYLFQTWGLLYTTPTNSGLITGLFVVFAPLTAWLLFKVRIPPIAKGAIVLSLAGMVLLAGQSASLGRVGDVLTVVCAAGLGAHIALLSRYAPEHDAGALAFAQMIGMAGLFSVMWAVSPGPITAPPAEVWFAIVLTGIVASAGAFYVQTIVQQRISAARAAVILTMEPVFATFFGFWLAGDRLSPVQLVGAALILSALLVGELIPVLRRGK